MKEFQVRTSTALPETGAPLPHIGTCSMILNVCWMHMPQIQFARPIATMTNREYEPYHSCTQIMFLCYLIKDYRKNYRRP